MSFSGEHGTHLHEGIQAITNSGGQMRAEFLDMMQSTSEYFRTSADRICEGVLAQHELLSSQQDRLAEKLEKRHAWQEAMVESQRIALEEVNC